MPTDDIQEAIRKKFNDVYKPASASTRDKKIALARNLMASSDDFSQIPNEQFVVLRTAMELARDAGDAGLTQDELA